MSTTIIKRERLVECTLPQTEEIPTCDVPPVLERITPSERQALREVLEAYEAEIGPATVQPVQIDWTGSKIMHVRRIRPHF